MEISDIVSDGSAELTVGAVVAPVEEPRHRMAMSEADIDSMAARITASKLISRREDMLTVSDPYELISETKDEIVFSGNADAFAEYFAQSRASDTAKRAATATPSNPVIANEVVAHAVGAQKYSMDTRAPALARIAAVDAEDIALRDRLVAEYDNPIARIRAVNDYVITKLAATDEEGALEMIWEAGSYLLIPFRSSEAMAAANGYLQNGIRPLLGVNVVKGWQSFKEIYNNWWALNPEERILYADDLVDFIAATSRGNWIARAALISPFLEQNELFWNKIDLAGDTVDAALLTQIATKPLRLARAARSTNKFFRALERSDPKLAAKVVTVGLDNPAKAARANVSLVELADDAVPGVKTIAVSPEPDLVSDATRAPILDSWVESIQTRADNITRTLNEIDWESRVFVDRTKAAEAQAEAMGKVNAKPNVLSSRVVSSDNTGFELEVVLEPRSKKGRNLSEVVEDLANTEAQIARLEIKLENLRDVRPGSRSSLDPTVADDKASALAEIAKLEKRRGSILTEKNQIETADVVSTNKIPYTREVHGVFPSVHLRGIEAVSGKDVVLDSIMPQAVGEATALDFKSAGIREVLTKAWAEANRGVSRAKIPGIGKSRMNLLEMVEEAGDEASRVFTVGELRSGIRYRGGNIKLEPHEIQSYYLRRGLMDKFHGLKNYMTRRQLEADGYRLFTLKGIAGVTKSTARDAFARPIKDPDAIPAPVLRLYDENSRKVVDVTKQLRGKVTGSGGKLQVVRFNKPIKVGEETIEYGIAKAESLRDLPQQVLNYRRGYLPRIRRNVHYTVSKKTAGLRNGVATDAANSPGDIVRFFDNKADADDWAAVQKAKPENENSLFEVKSSYDEMSKNPRYLDDLDINGYGGLFLEERTDNMIYKGWNDEIPETLSANEAVEAYLNHLSLRYPMNEWRMSMISKWLNTYRDVLDNPEDFRSTIKAGAPSDLARSAEVTRRNLEDMLYIPTASEHGWELHARQLSEWLSQRFEGGSWNPMARRAGAFVMDTLYDKNPVTAMKALAFHSMLGWFNPAQLFVQASGSYLAFALSPIRAPKMTARYAALRAAMYTDNLEAWRKTGKAAYAVTGMDADEFVEFVRAFRSTGIQYSVRSTADYAAATAGLPLSRGALSAAANKGLVFFREGELYPKSLGWMLAADDLMKARGIKSFKNLSKAEIDEITGNSLKYTMNLNRANRNAGWQVDWRSVPLQFSQIMLRFIENMVPEMFGSKAKWTPAQRASVLAHSFLLFGAAGVPFAQWGLGNLKDAMMERKALGEDDPDGNIMDSLYMNNPDALLAARNGILGWAVNDVFGIDAAFSSRVSIPAGIEQWVETIVSGDARFWEVISGPFGSIGIRSVDVGNAALRMLRNKESNPEKLMAATLEAARLTSSWNNASKAKWFWDQQKLLIQRPNGDVIGSVKDLDPEKDYMTVVAQAMGFTPNRIEYYREFTGWDRNNENEIRDRVRSLRNHFYDSMPREGFESEEALAAFANVNERLLDGLSPEGKSVVLQRFYDAMSKDEKDLWFEAAEKTLKNTNMWESPETTIGGQGVPFNPITTAE